MTVSFELWQLVSLASALLGAYVALGAVLLRMITRNIERALGQIREDSKKWNNLERDFLKHLADLPIHYVRREDYVRGQTVIEAKLDAIANELKLVQIAGGKS